MAAGASSLLSPSTAVAQRSRPEVFVIREDRFGRIFPNLPSFADTSTRLLNALREIGEPGGILDAADDLAAGPVALVANPALSANNQNNPTHTAGTTFMGQFIDHDLTFDLTSRLAVRAEPTQSPNERTPALDLDAVYGGGPLADPGLYVPVSRFSRERPTKLKIERGPLFEDLPRRADRSAIIADPRNDENLIIAGLQAAFILFHNKAVDLVSDQRLSSEEIFLKARRLTTWHYQWMVVHEFLPLFIGQALVDDLFMNGRRVYRPSVPFIPVEF